MMVCKHIKSTGLF